MIWMDDLFKEEVSLWSEFFVKECVHMHYRNAHTEWS
jgi:hypothetical protein